MSRTLKLDGAPLSEWCNPVAARQVLELRRCPLRCENCGTEKRRRVVLEDEAIFFSCLDCGHVNDPC